MLPTLLALFTPSKETEFLLGILELTVSTRKETRFLSPKPRNRVSFGNIRVNCGTERINPVSESQAIFLGGDRFLYGRSLFVWAIAFCMGDRYWGAIAFLCAIALGIEMLWLVNCRKPSDAIIMPTDSQLLKCLVLCQILSNCYRPIQLVRYDENRKEIFIIAGELGTIEITIFEQGQWRYDITQA